MLNEVNDETKVSLGLAATIFKIRFGNQKKKKKISTTGNTAKLLSCQNIYDH